MKNKNLKRSPKSHYITNIIILIASFLICFGNGKENHYFSEFNSNYSQEPNISFYRRSGFNTRTSKTGSNDIISDGFVAPAFSKSLHDHVTSGQTFSSTFWAQLSASEGKQPLKGPPSIECDNETVCSPFLSGELASGDESVNDETPRNIVIHYNCTNNGSSDVKFTFHLSEPYGDLSFYWHKICGGSRPGFQVGTSPGANDVVSNGVAQLLWSTTVHAHTILQETLSTTFYLQLISDEEPQSFRSPLISVSNPRVADPVYMGNITTTDEILPHDLLTLNVVYQCQKAQDNTHVLVTIPLDVFDDIEFEFSKNCGGHRKGLNVGTEPFGSQVGSDGLASPEWSPQTHVAFLPKRIFSTSFYFSLTTSIWQQLGNSPVSLEISPSDMVDVTLSGPINQGAGGIISEDESEALNLKFDCFAEGEATIQVDVPFAGFLPFSFAFAKKCGGYFYDLQVSHNHPGVYDVVNNGIAEPGWSPYFHDEFVGDRTFQSAFYIQFTSGNVSLSLDSVNVTVDDETILSPVLTGNATQGGPITTDVIYELVIGYNCHQAKENNLTVSINIEDFESTQFSWTKKCGGYRYGFEISSQYAQADVISNGLASPSWSPRHHNHVVHEMIMESTFLIDLNSKAENPQQTGGVQVSSDSFLIGVDAFGNATSSHILYPSGAPLELNLVYNCTAKEQANITVEIPLPGYNSALFGFVKSCGGYRIGFSIGTLPFRTDVVNNGLASIAWSPDLHQETLPATSVHSIFYIHIDNSESQTISSPFIEITTPSNNSASLSFEEEEDEEKTHDAESVLTAQISGNVTSTTRLEPHVIYSLQVDYECHITGQATVNAIIPLPGFKDILFSWDKRCGGYLQGLEVGTYPGDSSVASNGIARPEWQRMLHQKVMSPLTFDFTFYITYNNPVPQEFSSPIISVHDESIITLELLGNATLGGEFDENTLYILQVEYECLKTGKTVIEVGFDLEPFRNLTFSWEKRCGGYRQGINIGTEPKLSDVVLNGITEPAWNPKFHQEVVHGSVYYTTFYMMLDTSVSQIYGSPVITVSDRDVLEPQLYGNATDTSYIEEGEILELTVKYECARIGESEITTWIPLGDGFKSLIWTWTKFCGQKRTGFNIGTSPGGSADVVTSGSVQAAWSPSVHTIVVSQRVESKSLYFWLDKESPLPPFQVIETPSISLSSSSILNAFVAGDLSDGGNISTSESNSGTYPYIRLDFDCEERDTDIVYVDIRFSAHDGYVFHPLKFAFEKECGGRVYAFQIGDLGPSSTNVVADGLTYPSWSYHDPVEFFSPYIFDKSFHFFRENTSSIQTFEYLPPTVEIEDPSLLDISISGSAYEGGVLSSEADILRFQFECRNTGSTTVSVNISMAESSLWDPVLFAFNKRCGGTRDGFTVKSGDLDLVVENGMAIGNWTSDTPEKDKPYYDGNDGDNVFHYVLDRSPYDFQRFLPPVLNIESSTGNISAFLSGPGSEGGLLSYNGVTSFVRVQYNCENGGSAIFNLDTNITQFDPVSFQWQKDCGGVRDYLNVGTSPNQANIAQDGVTLEPWSLTRDAGNFTVVGRHTLRSEFYVWMSHHSQEIQGPIEVSVQEKETGRVFDSRDGSSSLFDLKRIGSGWQHGGTVSPFQVLHLSLEYNCISGGEAEMEVTLHPSPFKPVSFAWIKQCGGPRFAFEIDTSHHQNVASNGRTLPGWRASHPQHFIEAQPVSQNGQRFLKMQQEFILRLSEPRAGRQSFQLPSVNVEHAICPHVQLSGNATVPSTFDGDQREVILSSGESRVLNVDIMCHDGFLTESSINLDLTDNFDPIEFSWLSCYKEERRGFSIGTAVTYSDVVHNGIVNSTWSASNTNTTSLPDNNKNQKESGRDHHYSKFPSLFTLFDETEILSHSEDNGIVVEALENRTTLYVQFIPDSHDQPQLKDEEQQWSNVTLTFDSTVLSNHTKLAQGAQGGVVNRNDMDQIVIDYHCYRSGDAQVYLSMRLPPCGLKIQLSWIKKCKVPGYFPGWAEALIVGSLAGLIALICFLCTLGLCWYGAPKLWSKWKRRKEESLISNRQSSAYF